MASLARGVQAAIVVCATEEPHPCDVWRLRSALETFTRDQLADGIRRWCWPDTGTAEGVVAFVDRFAADQQAQPSEETR